MLFVSVVVLDEEPVTGGVRRYGALEAAEAGEVLRDSPADEVLRRRERQLDECSQVHVLLVAVRVEHAEERGVVRDNGA